MMAILELVFGGLTHFNSGEGVAERKQEAKAYLYRIHNVTSEFQDAISTLVSHKSD